MATLPCRPCTLTCRLVSYLLGGLRLLRPLEVDLLRLLGLLDLVLLMILSRSLSRSLSLCLCLSRSDQAGGGGETLLDRAGGS